MLDKTVDLIVVLTNRHVAPPLTQVSILVVQPATIIETMSQLVTQNCSDGSVVQSP